MNNVTLSAILFFNSKKAFANINRNILTKKLKAYNIDNLADSKDSKSK